MSSSLAQRTFAVLARVLGLAALLLSCRVSMAASVVRTDAQAETSKSGSSARAQQSESDELDGGACGEDEEVEEEEVDCTIDISRLESGLLALVRASIEGISADQCKVLLDQLYDRQMCRIEGPECGKLVRFAPLPVAPKLSSSSSSGQTLLGYLDVGMAAGRLLTRPGSDRPLRDRALAPPERPPRGHALG